MDGLAAKRQENTFRANRASGAPARASQSVPGRSKATPVQTTVFRLRSPSSLALKPAAPEGRSTSPRRTSPNRTGKNLVPLVRSQSRSDQPARTARRPNRLRARDPLPQKEIARSALQPPAAIQQAGPEPIRAPPLRSDPASNSAGEDHHGNPAQRSDLLSTLRRPEGPQQPRSQACRRDGSVLRGATRRGEGRALLRRDRHRRRVRVRRTRLSSAARPDENLRSHAGPAGRQPVLELRRPTLRERLGSPFEECPDSGAGPTS